MSSKIQKNSLIQKMVLHASSLLNRYVFERIYHYFPDKEEIHQPHPTIILCNHVDHRDVIALTSFFKYTVENIRYTVPVRADIMQAHFLQKEYKPKGFKKLLLGLIDSLHIIPALFHTIGAVPIKRPFRDNSRELVKIGSFKEEVEKDWQTLADNVNAGRNLVLFPEGTLTQNGDIKTIRNGISFLLDKVSFPKLYVITLTYDFLVTKKPTLHVKHSLPFVIQDKGSKEELSSLLHKKLQEGFIITQGNLFSYLLFLDKVKVGMNTEAFREMMNRYISELHKSNLTISKDMSSIENPIYERLMENAISSGFLKKENDMIRSTDKLYIEPSDKKYRKQNPYMYHRNQVRSLLQQTLL
jgi:hypothetical protein